MSNPMSRDTRPRRGTGRLSRRDQGKLGELLKQVYESIVREGVPDRFKKLLNELEIPENSAIPIEAVGEPQDQLVEVLRPDQLPEAPSIQKGRASE